MKIEDTRIAVWIACGAIVLGATASYATSRPNVSGADDGTAPVTANYFPGSGLANTAHDFTQSSYALEDKDGNPASVGLCTFCHTPHKATKTRLLWNHTLSSATYSWDESTTSNGTTLPSFTNSWNGPSVKCLSCHDGSVAVGDIAWFKEGSATGANAYVLTGLDATGKITDSTYQIGRTGGTLGNMTGNHPVAIPYPLASGAVTYNSVSTMVPTTIAASEWVADPTLNGIVLYSDDGSSSVTRVTADNGGVGARTTVGIECSSCHDPHNKETADDLFLRGSLTGTSGTGHAGYICEKCHNK